MMESGKSSVGQVFVAVSDGNSGKRAAVDEAEIRADERRNICDKLLESGLGDAAEFVKHL